MKQNKRVMVQDSLVITVRSYLKNNESKKGWENGSSGRVPAWY
jgi:hypothetical protein